MAYNDIMEKRSTHPTTEAIVNDDALVHITVDRVVTLCGVRVSGFYEGRVHMPVDCGKCIEIDVADRRE